MLHTMRTTTIPMITRHVLSKMVGTEMNRSYNLDLGDKTETMLVNALPEIFS